MTMPMIDDPVTQLQHAPHDPAAFAALVACHQSDLVCWLERVLRNRDLADEAVQETWLVISRGSWRFAAHSDDPAGDVRAWLRQVALRAAFRLRAGQRRQGEVLAQVARDQQKPSSPSPLEQLAESDQRAVVWAAIAELPPLMRHALELRFHHGLDFAAIGQAQQCTALTARVRTWRALGTLRRQLLLLGLSLVPTTLATLLAAEASSVITSTTDGDDVGSTGVQPSGLLLVAGLGHPRWLMTFGVLVPVMSLATWHGVMSEESPSPPVIDHGMSTPTLAVTATASEAAPWLLRDEPWTHGLPPEVDEVGSSPHGHFPELQADVRVINDSEVHLSYPRDRVTVLTPEQLAELPHGLTPSSKGATLRNIALQSAQRAHVMNLHKQRDFHAGYAVGDDGKIAPVTKSFPEGVVCRFSVRAWSDGACRVMASATQREVIAQESRSFTIDGPLAKDLGTHLSWDELTFRENRTVALPDGGMVVPPGASLLLPSTGSVMKHQSPSGVFTAAENAPDSDPWWVVITPVVLPADAHDPEPHQPEARG
jgi:RNA polymerase sigma-70 factor, ECF subfamily